MSKSVRVLSLTDKGRKAVSRPVRVQLSRSRGWKMPANTVKCDRTTPWGNVVAVGSTASVEAIDGRMYCVTVTPAIAVAIHAEVVREKLERDPGHLEPLRGKNLACWCKLDQPCHVDTLLTLANR